jgi:hypothetical protein
MKSEKNREQIMHLFSLYLSDKNLNVWHLAILIALLNIGYSQGRIKSIQVSRSRIMNLSHIHTIPTYHKYFKQLQDLGCISYQPSYHPACRSEINLHFKWRIQQ